MSTARWVTGDVLEVLAKIPDQSIDLVVTSPPFLALRSYLPADDPAKPYEIGQEPNPGAFLDVMLDFTEQLGRVLSPWGSIVVEFGDTYSGSGGHGGDYEEGGMREGQPKFAGAARQARSPRFREGTPRWDGRPEGQTRTTDWPPDSGARDAPQEETDGAMKYARIPSDGRPPIRDLNGKVQGGGDGWPEAKSLCLIPELYRVALAYGFNPLTGRATPRWRIRNVVRWCRPNPPVGALADKFRNATSELVVACRTDEAGRTRYFDMEAVRVPYSEGTKPRTAKGVDQRQNTTKQAPDGNRANLPTVDNNGTGAPPLDWWEIPTEPYPGSHYATFPRALVERPIKSMSPAKVCRTCGQPSRRITERDGTGQNTRKSRGLEDHPGQVGAVSSTEVPDAATVRSVGWTDCGHDNWRPGRVLDPFAGSGTTLAVAQGHGRDAIGIDLDQRNADQARDRVGGLFFHELTADELAEEL